jgi:DNA-binding NarL/FixJ family response regulator
MAATIVLVDDHVQVRALLRGIVAQALQPDILLLDLTLRWPKVERPEITVIMMTGHADDAYCQSAVEGGSGAFLFKKTLVTVLLPTLQRLCGALPPPLAS